MRALRGLSYVNDSDGAGQAACNERGWSTAAAKAVMITAPAANVSRERSTTAPGQGIRWVRGLRGVGGDDADEKGR